MPTADRNRVWLAAFSHEGLWETVMHKSVYEARWLLGPLLLLSFGVATLGVALS
jgi:hypothetical protein